MRARIAVIGSDGAISDAVSEIAKKIGSDIAKNDAVLICGGRGGVMEAACKGAKDAGGLTVGILPSKDGADANPYVDVAVTTGLGIARNSIVACSADVVIAVCGSTGTMSEIAFALNFGRPVVVVEGSGGISERIKQAFPENENLKKIVIAKPADAVAKALQLL